MKYNIIYADPPWEYYNKNCNGSAQKQYSCMKLKDICDLPINSISAKDTILFLWSTFPQIPNALKVIEAWGFQYKTTAFVWVKENKSKNGYFFGLGYWTRSNAEICLLATKGKPKRVSRNIHQLIISPVEQHSKKPNIVRTKIVELMGDLPRIELFSRNVSEGWHVWGNEVKSDIIL